MPLLRHRLRLRDRAAGDPASVRARVPGRALGGLRRRPGATTPANPRAHGRGEVHGIAEEGTWIFNLDLGLGGFGFANSLYTNVRPDPSGDLSDNWVESFAKPAISASFGLGQSELYGKVSAVGERTFAAPPSLVGESASSFQVEDLSLGWRSGKSLGSSENLLNFTLGRTQYTIAHGLLLWDGAGEGGSRGGYWSNARRAWEFAAVGRLKRKESHSRGLLPRPGRGSGERHGQPAVGRANYELAVGQSSTLGASYLKAHADRDLLPERDRLNVYGLRAFTAPFPGLPDPPSSWSTRGRTARPSTPAAGRRRRRMR